MDFIIVARKDKYLKCSLMMSQIFEIISATNVYPRNSSKILKEITLINHPQNQIPIPPPINSKLLKSI